jgi:hypothetical protein
MTKAPTIDDLREGLVIDPNNLDEMLMGHPMLFWAVSEQYVLAASLRDAAKEEISVIDAEMNSDIRKEIEEAGDKVTEKLVESHVLINPLHQEAVQKHRDAKTKADLWNALKDSFSSRNYMLREMASLLVSNYYSVDSARDGANYEHTKAEMSEQRKRKRSKL